MMAGSFTRSVMIVMVAVQQDVETDIFPGTPVPASILTITLANGVYWTNSKRSAICRSGCTVSQLPLRYRKDECRQSDIVLHIPSRISSLECGICSGNVPLQPVHDPCLLRAADDQLRYVLHLFECEACFSGEACHGRIRTRYCELHQSASGPSPAFDWAAMLRSYMLPTPAIQTRI